MALVGIVLVMMASLFPSGDSLMQVNSALRSRPIRSHVGRLLSTLSADDWKVVPDIWETLQKKHPDAPMVSDPIHGDHTVDLSYGQFNELITKGAGALQKLGIKSGDCVSMFAENSHRWLIADQAVMKAGACNAVRGAQSSVDELRYIYNNSQSKAVFCETPTLLEQLFESNSDNALKSRPPAFIVVLFSRGMTGAELAASANLRDVKVLSFEEFISMGTKDDYQPVVRDPQATATLVYTSGTTAYPKGAMLSHSNLLYQVTANTFGTRSDPMLGDIFLSILPVWHIFERSAEYFCLARGSQMVYSNLRNFKNDLTFWRPHYVIAVPRLFETIHKGVVGKLRAEAAWKRRLISTLTAFVQMFIRAHKTWANLLVRAKKPGVVERLLNAFAAVLLWPVAKLADFVVWSKIRKNMGGRVKVMVSGGSALPPHIDSFFDMVGVRVVAGYGLTETSPTLLNRKSDRNVLGTVGVPPPGTTIKIVDPESRQPVAAGQSGLLLAKGPGVMLGYKADAEATAQAIDTEGYFNTGDLGRVNPATGDVLITGREKDTIVLNNGENVAPQPIEDSIQGMSALVEQCMLLGQDEKYLGALVVLSPAELFRRGLVTESLAYDIEKAQAAAAALGGNASNAVRALLKTEAQKLNNREDVKEALRQDLDPVFAKLRPWERVQAFKILFEPFTIANGQLTLTQKIKRSVVAKLYAAEIVELYQKKK